jgi:hypothetical protein
VIVLALAAILGSLRYNSVQPCFDQAALAVYNDQPIVMAVAPFKHCVRQL